MNPALRVESLTIHSTENDAVIVNPVSFQLAAGIPVNLLGETGSGKSLIAQAILGNLAETLQASGKIWINGTEYLGQPSGQRKKLWGRSIGLLPQEPWLSLNPTKRSLRQLSEVYQYVTGKRKRASTTAAKNDLVKFDIRDTAKKLPHELSGGMAQRLVFCCTMAGGANILMVDEPTKGLDADRKQDVIEQLKQFVRNGGHLLVITHDIEVAEQLDGQTVVMRGGEVLEKDRTAKLFSAPQKAYTQALMDAAPKNWSRFPSAAAQQPPAVSCTGVSKSRSGRLLFSDLNLTIHRGEIVGLYGPSGSGKSTLGDILLGLVPPDSGRVKTNPDFKPFQFLKLYQDPPSAFSPFHTLRSTLQDFLDLHRIAPHNVSRLLGKLNLDQGILERNPGNISGGELQRIALMRALLLDPVFLFADEPTSRLDPVTQKETVALLSTVAREKNCGILMVSHDYELLDKRCDSIFNLVRQPSPLGKGSVRCPPKPL